MQNYPTKLYQGKNPNQENRTIRKTSTKELKKNAKTKVGDNSFCINAAKMWNKSPMEIKEVKTITLAKQFIKAYSKIMPI